MNIKLSPVMLLIIGIALLYFGGASGGGGLSVGLSVGGLVCLFIAIAAGVKKLGRKTDNIAKASSRSKHKSKSTSIKDAEEYADAVLYLSATNAERMRHENHLTDNQSSEIMIQIFAFCIINLMKKFKISSVPVGRGQDFVDETLKLAAKRADAEHKERAYIAYGNMVSDLSNRFGSLPLSHTDSDKQGGTFLWEYAKHMNETMGKDKLDLETLMLNVSVITNINNSIDTSFIIESLR